MKTGTTNDYRDGWTIGYTPSLVVGAWAGNNNNKAMLPEIAGFVIAGIGDSIKFGEGVAGLVGLGVSIALLLWVNWPKQYTAI